MMKKTLRFQILFAGLLAAATGFLAAQTPVASYSFSGNLKDGSANGNHAAANGASLTQDRFGFANSAIYFDGVQGALTVPNSAVLNSAAATVSFWVNVAAIPPSGEVYLLSNGGYQERWKVSLPDHGKPVFTTHSNGACCSDLDSGTPLVVGAWVQIVMVHDGAKDLIYINGQKVNEKAAVGSLDATTKPFGMGWDPIGGGNFFNGTLDDVLIFDVALDAPTITALYFQQNTAPTVATGLVASYSFSGDGRDNSTFGNHADVQTADATTDRFGFGNSALAIDGASSEASAPNSAALNSASTTISFWAKANSFPVSGEVYLLSNGGYQERWKISMPSHGKPVFTTHSGGACCSDLDSGTPLTVGKWTHIVMTHDGAKDIIYFNGLKVNEKNAPGALDATTAPLGIGFDPIGGGGWFDGSIDEIQISNVALSATEIAGLYLAQSAFPGVAGDLVAAYSLNGNGDDDSQFLNHATAGGGPASPFYAKTNRHGWASNASSDFFEADNSAALQSDFTTISFWAKPASFPVSGEVFLMSNGGWQSRWKISMPSHGKPVFTTHSGGACCSDLDTGTPLTLDTWTHIVAVHDGAKDILYLNGVKANEKTAAGLLDKTHHPLGIGWDPIDGGSYFDGALDDVLIYNRALSATEIADLYTAQNASPTVSGTLVADYQFAGDGDDATAYKNHSSGAFLGNDRFGKAGKAAQINGTAKVTAANSPQLNSANTTLSFWVNAKTFPASGEVYLLSHGGYQERWKISLPSHGKPVFTTHSGGNCCSDLDSGTPLVLNSWTHVVMTHDGAKDIIYFNGVKTNEKNALGSLDATTKPLGIGYDPIDNNYVFDGSLDDVQIYNVALSAAEVAALFSLQSQPPVSLDNEAPDAPLNLAAAVTFTDVYLWWLPANDNVGVVAYNLFQDGNLIQTVPTNAAFVSGLAPLTDFVFGVSAIDAAGNESVRTTLKVKSGTDSTPDTEAPTAPGNLAGTAASNAVLLSWDASTDNTQVAGYVIFVDGVVFDTVSGTTLSSFIGGLDPSTLYTFEVSAFDLAGNNSAASELTLSTKPPIVTAEPGLIAHYPFDGNANDATPYLNHGAIGGNPVFEVPTHPNGGGQNIKFDGLQDSVLVPNAAHLISDFTTVSFWIRVDSTNLANAEAYVIDFGHWSERWKISLPQHLKIVWTTNSKTVQFPVLISDMDSGDGNEMVKGFWWYVTMVHDGVNDVVYVNGVQTKIKPAPGKLNTTARPLCFGSNPIEGGQYFIGALDNVKIYNKALTAGEVDALYLTGTTADNEPNDDGLRGLVLNISPNPTTDLLTVRHAFSGNEAVLVRVFDVAGRQVDALNFARNEVPTDYFSLETGGYSPGIYELNFVVGGRNLGSVMFAKQ